MQNAQYDQAIEAFEKQFTIIDNIADSYYFLGLAYKGKSNFEEANIQFSKALTLLQDINRHRIFNGFRVSELDVKKEISAKGH